MWPDHARPDKPVTLSESIARQRRGVVQLGERLAYPHQWQVPAATEKFAWESVLGYPGPLGFEYIGFPWAALLDGLRGNAASIGPLLMALNELAIRPRRAERRITVAQHIHAMRFPELFRSCGITDVCWSHAIHGQREIDGLKIHPFALYPAQVPQPTDLAGLTRSRRYLANFIGAYSPGLYLTNVRDRIYNDRNAHGDLLIVRRDAWHFDRAVYDEQVKGVVADAQRLQTEERLAREYIEGIAQSWFTLCPSGSGPNSIRIFESLALGSIPIILTRSLRLPGPASGWENSAVIEDDTEAGYVAALERARQTSIDQRLQMLKAGRELLDWVGPPAYAKLIVASLARTYQH